MGLAEATVAARTMTAEAATKDFIVYEVCWGWVVERMCVVGADGL